MLNPNQNINIKIGFKRKDNSLLMMRLIREIEVLTHRLEDHEQSVVSKQYRNITK